MAKKTATKKVKKKKWYPIIAPKLFNEKVLGECLLVDSSSMQGKTITLNMMNIVGDPKKQSTNIQFLITNVIDGKGMTEIIKYEITPSFIKRLVRRGKNKVDDSFLAVTADKKSIRVKPMVITLRNTNKSVINRIRVEQRKLLKERLSKMTFVQIVESLIQYRFQRETKSVLSKIYPLRVCEIRFLSINKRKKYVEAQRNEVASVSGIEVSNTQKQEVSDAPEAELLSEVKVEAKEEVKEEKKEEAPKKKEKKVEVKKEKKAPAKKAKKTPTKKEVKKKAESKKKPAAKKETKKVPAKKKPSKKK